MTGKAAPRKKRGVALMTKAAVTAQDLGGTVHRIDLAGIISRHIGETEKALDAVFAKAQAAGAVLLFDEADALFGTRAGDRDSDDRYAAIDTTQLLARIERYEGLVVVVTDDAAGLDDAFVRRLRMTADLPKPAAPERTAIWKKTP